MNYLRIFVIGLICTVLVNCNGVVSDKKNDVLADHPLVIDSLAVLDETSKILGQPASFTFISEKEFALVTKQGEVATYNLNGEKTHSFSKIGTGPLEYLDPGFIKFYKNRLFIWCKQLLKLVVFDIEGNPLEEYTRFSNAIRGFEIVDDKVFFYRSGAASSPIIEIYDLASQELTSEVGINSKESALLTMIPCAGGLNVVDDQVFFISPGELNIKYFNVKSPDTVRDITITDTDFRIEQLSTNKYEKIGSNIGLRVDFVNKNSSVGGLHIVNDMLVIKMVVGEYEYEDRWDSSSFNRSKRFEKYLLLDKSMNIVRALKGPISKTSNCLIESNGKSLFTISAVESSEPSNFVYQLNRINLNQ